MDLIPPPEALCPPWPSGLIHGMFEMEPPPRRWFCKDRLLAGRAHALAGLGGSSKTRVQYHLAIGGVLGQLPWPWEVQSTGSAALFLTEDVADDVHRALHELGRHLKPAERRLLEQRLRVYPLAGRRSALLQFIGGVLHESSAYDWLMSEIITLPEPVVFVGLDPAIGLTEGEELNSTHQRRLGELVDRIAIDSGACTLLTCHAAKNHRAADELESHSARGSGAITDAVRGELCVRNMTADEARSFGIEDRAERKRYLQLAATKGNALPPEAYEPLWLKHGSEGWLEHVTLEQVKHGSVNSREREALELLKRTAAQGDTSMRFWLAECVTAGLISASAKLETQQKSMERIRNALRDAGLIAPGSFRGSWVPTSPTVGSHLPRPDTTSL